MMMPSHTVRILVATQPVDFRKGHDGLAALVQSVLKEDPFTHCRQVNAWHSPIGAAYFYSGRSVPTD